MVLDLRVHGRAAVRKGFVVGYRAPANDLVMHVAIAVSDASIEADGQTTVVHMVPRGVETTAGRVDVVAPTTWLSEDEVDLLLDTAYSFMPPRARYSRSAEVPASTNAEGRYIPARYSCSGFVRKVFRELDVELLESPLPSPAEGILDAFRVPADERQTGEALLPGYVVHACASPARPHGTAPGEAFVPARLECA